MLVFKTYCTYGFSKFIDEFLFRLIFWWTIHLHSSLKCYLASSSPYSAVFLYLFSQILYTLTNFLKSVWNHAAKMKLIFLKIGINIFKYHVSCSDGKISVRFILIAYLFTAVPLTRPVENVALTRKALQKRKLNLWVGRRCKNRRLK